MTPEAMAIARLLLRLEQAVKRGEDVGAVCRELFGDEVGAEMLADIEANSEGQWSLSTIPNRPWSAPTDRATGT